jgi:RNA polymerase sigma-70 factor (ECF subfamily)
MIERGLQYLALASTGETVTEYHLQAGIAACHCVADDESTTDWPRILALYDRLAQLNRSPVIALNRAVAVARVHGPQAGLDALHTLSPRASLDDYYLYHAVHGTFAVELGLTSEALAHFRKAESLALLPSEREFLARRIHDCAADSGELGASFSPDRRVDSFSAQRGPE